MSTRPTVLVEGTVRSTALFENRQEQKIIGVKCTVLTEPASGFLEVVIPTSMMDTQKALQLVDKYVHWRVDLRSWGGARTSGITADFIEEVTSPRPAELATASK